VNCPLLMLMNWMHLAGLSSSQSLPPDFPFFSIFSFKDYGRQLAPFSPGNTRCQVRFCTTTQCREIEHRQLDPRAKSQPRIHSRLSSPPHPQTLNPFSSIAAYNIRRRDCVYSLYMGLAVETSFVSTFPRLSGAGPVWGVLFQWEGV